MSVADAELARRSGDGDVGAYEELLRRHRCGVFRIARAILGSDDDAEDVAQEALVKAYRAIRGFDHRREFVAWLRRITVNCAISKLRQRGRLRKREQDSPGAEAPAARTTEGQVVAGELRAQVREALASLPPRQRVAVTLFALRETDLAETADAMGCSVGAVKTHLHRARRKLAEMLSPYVEEE